MLRIPIYFSSWRIEQPKAVVAKRLREFIDGSEWLTETGGRRRFIAYCDLRGTLGFDSRVYLAEHRGSTRLRWWLRSDPRAILFYLFGCTLLPWLATVICRSAWKGETPIEGTAFGLLMLAGLAAPFLLICHRPNVEAKQLFAPIAALLGQVAVAQRAAPSVETTLDGSIRLVRTPSLIQTMPDLVVVTFTFLCFSAACCVMLAVVIGMGPFAGVAIAALIAIAIFGVLGIAVRMCMEYLPRATSVHIDRDALRIEVGARFKRTHTIRRDNLKSVRVVETRHSQPWRAMDALEFALSDGSSPILILAGHHEEVLNEFAAAVEKALARGSRAASARAVIA